MLLFSGIVVGTVGVWMLVEAIQDWRVAATNDRSVPNNPFRYVHTVAAPMAILATCTVGLFSLAETRPGLAPLAYVAVALGVAALALAPLVISLWMFERPRILIPPRYKNPDGSIRKM